MEKAILAVLIVALLGVGSLFVASAVTNTNPLNYFSSVRVADTEKDNSELSESQESAQLASLAKITAEEAKTIALGAVNIDEVGEVTNVLVENENGNVIYSVEFTKNSIETDVKIDSGNGQVLKIESDKNEVDKENNINSEAENDLEKDTTNNEKDNINHEFEGEEEHED